MRLYEFRNRLFEQEEINEAGLSRMVDMMKKRDFIVVSGFRNPISDEMRAKYSLKEQQAINRYNSAKIKGEPITRDILEAMPEGAKEIVDKKIMNNRKQNQRILNFINSKSEQMGGYKMIGF
jgi:TRAP-type mannitol/chloroaromatic compound transport system substrate-binding protein